MGTQDVLAEPLILVDSDSLQILTRIPDLLCCRCIKGNLCPISVFYGTGVTPILVSTGSGNIVMLFIYLAVVNIGLYPVARHLKSQMLILVASAGTVITLALGISANYYRLPNHTVASVWIANLGLFSIFLGLSNHNPKDNLIPISSELPVLSSPATYDT